MKKIILIIISALVTSSLFSQRIDSTEMARIHEFGIHAGASTGVGLSYRYWPKKAGVQITMLPIKTKDQTFFSIGITGLYSFYNSRLIRFFGYLGNNVMIDNHRTYEYTYNPNSGFMESTNGKMDKKTMYNVGFGPGFGFGTKVRFNIMAGYGFYDILDEFNIYPTGEIGLYFRL